MNRQPLILESSSILITDNPQELLSISALQGVDVEIVAPTVAVSKLGIDELATLLLERGISTRRDEGTPTQLAFDLGEKVAFGFSQVRSLLNEALEKQRQVEIRYFASSKDAEMSVRTIDVRRIDGNLITAWCHLRNDERHFALERIGQAVLLPTKIKS